MRILVPNFIELGQSIRVRGEGLTKSNGEKGDLLVTPSEIEYYDTELTISACLTGASDSVTKMPLYLPHAGKTIQISVPNDIVVGKTLRLKGLGLDAPNGEKGDLYLHFDHIDYTQTAVTPPEAEEKEDPSKRKQEYVGKIKKCPACGEEIPALTAICPACGHELNSACVSAILREFIDNINECDRRIANAPNPPKTGWASWSKAKRVWWVILNIFTSCIPLVVYLVMPLLRYNSTPKLTADEKQKASLIENFPFPNDRESILEALLFTKSKVAFLASEKVDRKTAYWTRLWSTKAEQLYQKAEIMFKGDPVASDAIKEIITQKVRVSKTVKFRAIAGVVVLLVALVFFGVRNGLFEVDITDYNATFEWQTNDLFAYLPQPDTNFGRIARESEKQINIELYQISQDQFDAYVKACREKGFSIDVTKTDSVF